MTTSLWPDLLHDEGALVPARTFERARVGTSVQPHASYQRRPEDWIVEKLGIPRATLRWSLNQGYRKHPWDGTPDPLIAILEGLAQWEDVGVESATGTGKSFLGACVVLWFLAAFKNSLVNTYAPKGDQLRRAIWKEIAELWPRFQRMFPSAELTDLRIRMDGSDKWSAHGISTALRAGEESATKAQGDHAEHMLTVTEETPGMEPAVMVALRNTRVGEHNIQLSIGNPDSQQDTLHTFCVLPETRHVIISAKDHPNVVTGRPIVLGAQSPRGIRRIAAEHAPGSPMYESRVRGISPAEASDALIKLAWCHAAALRLPALVKQGGDRAMGVDVANSENGDKASVSHWIGAACISVKSAPCPDSNRLGTEVVEMARKLGIAPEHVGVDPVGVGAGTVNEADRLHFPVRRLGGAESPVSGASMAADGSFMDWVPDANRFDNLRSQMAWQLREDLRKGRIGLPNDPALFRQLTALRYEPVRGKVVLEEKAKAKSRLGGKMDDFDSVMYGNWVRPRTSVTAPSDAGDDRHPGYDYKRRQVKRRHQPVGPDGTLIEDADDDLRPNRYLPPRAGGFRVPRMFGPEDKDTWNEYDNPEGNDGEED